MKLLLTSSGIKNASIAKALFELVGKKPEDTSLVFIPTAANVEMGDKSWLIDDLVALQKLGFKSIDIADISAVEQKVWQPKIEAADILFFEGGNTYHLMGWLNKSGLAALMPELLRTKVYVGVSAGSMVACPTLMLSTSQIVYEEDLDQIKDMNGLHLIDSYCLPHLNSPYFKRSRKDVIEGAVKGMTETVYALDDNSALKVVDGAIEVVSEGEWFVVNG